VPDFNEKQRRRSKYDEALKRAVVADVPDLGQRRAAHKHGVPPSCVSRWVKMYGSAIAEPAPAKAAPTPTTVALAAPVTAAATTVTPAAPITAVTPATPITAVTSAAPTAPITTAAAAAPVTPDVAAAAAASATEPAGSRTLARRYTPSEKAQALEYAAAHGVSAASKALGISRFALYQCVDGHEKARINGEVMAWRASCRVKRRAWPGAPWPL